MPRPVTLALLLTTLASLALVQGPPAPVAKEFKHGEHVQLEWLDPKVPEVWRDCRGCHRFDKDNLVSAPQQQCDECHGAGLAHAPGWPRDLRKFRSRTGDAFRHHTHAMLECRQCHGAISQTPGEKPTPDPGLMGVPADFDIRTGPGQCAKCHEAGRLDFAWLRFFDAEAEKAAKALGPEAYPKKLVEVFAGPTGGLNTQPLPVGGDLDHADHCGVVNGALGSLIACDVCHANIPQANARETGTDRIPLVECANCHKTDRAPARAAAAKRPLQRRLQSLGTFAHADHYGFLARGKKKGPPVCIGDAYARIEKGCDACHKSDPAAFGRPDADFPFRGGYSKDRYVDCKECHDVDGWQTGETPAEPLHASTGRSGWDRCEKCHVFGKPDMAKVRVMAEVERLAGRTFVFPANVHPDITKSGITRSEQELKGRAVVQECKECHRARVPALDTRLQKKEFRHDTHLPAAPEPKDCKECHPSASTAGKSAELAGSDRRTYTLSGCTRCHWGDPVVEERATGEEQLTAQKKTCVEFPHGPHVSAANLSCLQCHAVAADGQDIKTPGPEPRDLERDSSEICSKCHDHKAGQPGEPKYEGLFDNGALSCARCHHEATADNAAPVAVVPLPGAAATDPRYLVDQTAFAFADAQFHPLGVKCTECHKAYEKDGRLEEVKTSIRQGDRLFATLTKSRHAGGGWQPADCLRCHWKQVGKWRDAVNASTGTREEKALRLEPGSPATRAKFGNEREGYPGTDRAKG
ncbi:MAG TPA: cytochrome c3 family protein [Planctomycetota bacterium]|nr:cytochrome c3 family protein [Planctomycetota bacterium]